MRVDAIEVEVQLTDLRREREPEFALDATDVHFHRGRAEGEAGKCLAHALVKLLGSVRHMLVILLRRESGTATATVSAVVVTLPATAAPAGPPPRRRRGCN